MIKYRTVKKIRSPFLGSLFGVAAFFLFAAPQGWTDEGPGKTFRNSLEGYELVGIIEGETGDSGAIFENKSTKNQKLFRIGDRIENGTLAGITDGGVLIQQGDQTFRIRVGSGSPEMIGSGKPIEVPGGIEDPKTALTRVLSQEIPPYDPSLEKTPVSKRDRSLFIEGIQKGLEDGSLWVSTTFGNSLQLAHMDRQLLDRLGLDRGDVIVGISGMGFESPERVSDILSVLNRARVFNFSVLRDEVILPIYYSVS